jgi:hypothetical protein
MPILPESALPTAALPSPSRPTPATANDDFDRTLFPQRKHFPSKPPSSSSSSSPIPSHLQGKARAAFHPAYPRPSQVKGVPHRGDGVNFLEDDAPPIHTKRTYPDKTNVESLRGGAGAAASLSSEGAGPEIHRVGKVVDAATGKLARERRGVERDFLVTAGVPHLDRYGSDGYTEEEDILRRRGGLGFSKQVDKLYREVEWSNNFFSDKPGRWWTDPNGRPVKVAFVGKDGGRGHESSSSSGPSYAGPGGGGGAVRAGPTQLQANSAAIRDAATARDPVMRTRR